MSVGHHPLLFQRSPRFYIQSTFPDLLLNMTVHQIRHESLVLCQVISIFCLQVLDLIIDDGAILLFSGWGFPGDLRERELTALPRTLGRGTRHCREGRERREECDVCSGRTIF
ncbi:hypothetical protein CEXT_648781 [Caerostris extrusa]|uniref:Uncharacterized protein n=1 Tax=Caerostris extrusa TaxID=172846 RepID=A0AAV4M8S8_CAEEX|nr:hypothetical protein CEXT_648781 [Caerostris extrusa]